MKNNNQIKFVKASLKYKDTIFRWLAEPHVQEFWDNSQAHKDDIINFINGRKEPSDYAEGRFVYWIGLFDNVPYALVMTIQEYPGEEREKIKNDYLSTTGSTYGFDFMIGEKEYFGKGLGARTLKAFTQFFQEYVDHTADTFFIDPDVSNPRAKHVYEQAGFKHVGDFVMGGTGVFRGHKTHLLIKKLPSKTIEVEIINADQAETLCRTITSDLPDYFGIPSVNEKYFKGVRSCKNLAGKINNLYIGLLSLNFPYENNSNIYWMGVLKDFQNQGVGSKLVEEACQLAKKLNATTMTVETLAPHESDENYLKTYQFYQSAGFKPLIHLKPEGYEWNMVYMVKHFTALNELLYLEKDATAFGFEWPDEAMIIEQAMDECREIKEAIEKQEDKTRIQEEIGDLIHSAVSLCAFTGFDVEQTIEKINHKFGKRMTAMKVLTHELNLANLQGQSIDFMMELWRKAKVKK